jgi:serine/threonine protein phosphatase PrpC
MKITGMTAQGKRPYQEDRYLIHKDTDGGTVLAVFDGHGGKEVAELCQHMFPLIWERTKYAAFPYRMTEVFKQLHDATKAHEAGSTASIVYIPADKRLAHCAVLGDSPIWIVDAYSNLQKSPEHNIRTNEYERLQAVERGAHSDGYYIYDFSNDTGASMYASAMNAPGLQMSRALGDRFLDRVLLREPECYPVVLGPESKILVASDGAIDPIHSENVATTTLETMLYQGSEAKAYVEYALERKTGDNVTALTVDFEKDEIAVEPPFSMVLDFPRERIAA